MWLTDRPISKRRVLMCFCYINCETRKANVWFNYRRCSWFAIRIFTKQAKGFSPLFHPKAGITDDTIMTVAIADSLLNEIHPAVAKLGSQGLPTESLSGYGKGFMKWLAAPDIQPPYNSFGNGAAMRVSPVGWLFDELPVALEVAKIVTEVSHSHGESRGSGSCLSDLSSEKWS